MRQTSLLLFLAVPIILVAQQRYFDPVFPEVKVTSNVIYGINATVLFQAPPPNGVGEAIPQNLKMEVYEPQNDTAIARPLVILLHSGNFLPPQVNGGCSGTVLDGEIVALAQRLAQRGFVVAAADYRLGWNPIAGTQAEQVYTLTNALHRGVQDSRTCIRFFKKDHAENDRFRIDPDKITLWGSGTGGWISLASATLDTITDWYKQKFVSPSGPFLYEPVIGNLDGTSWGVVPMGGPLPHPGDTLCYPNHTDYNSNFSLAVNMAGILLDTSWLQANDIPIISFTSNRYSNIVYASEPCGIGDYGNYSPIAWLHLIPEVAGGCAVQARQAQLGNNLPWQNAGFNDPLTLHAQSINEGHEGFYPFDGTQEQSPWAFSTGISPYGVMNVMCDTGFVSASAYLDTVLAYFAPRACVALGLSMNCNTAVPVKEPGLTDNLLKISPNPAMNETRFFAVKSILSVELYDLNGRIVWQNGEINEREVRIPRMNLPSGIYWLRARFIQGSGVAKLIWK